MSVVHCSQDQIEAQPHSSGPQQMGAKVDMQREAAEATV